MELRTCIQIAWDTRGRGEVLGQAGAAKACAYHLNRSVKVSKSKITTNSSNSTTPCMSQYFPPHSSTSGTPLVIQARALKGTSYFCSKDSIGYQSILGFFRKRLSRNAGVTTAFFDLARFHVKRLKESVAK